MTYNTHQTDELYRSRRELELDLARCKRNQELAATLVMMVAGACFGALLFWWLSQ